MQPGLATHGPAALIADESRLTASVHGADLVVWGESSLGEDLAGRPVLLRALRRLARAAPVLVSEDFYSPAGAHSKVAVLIGPGGIEGTYTKTRLVPFGEYIPFRSVLGWLTRISRAASVNMAAGTGARVLHATLPDGRPLAFGVLICFESSFPDMSRVDTDHGAQVIIYQTSDSTFQGSWLPEQHASLAALRAAETGRPAVQAALTGDSSGVRRRAAGCWPGPELPTAGSCWSGSRFRTRRPGRRMTGLATTSRGSRSGSSCLPFFALLTGPASSAVSGADSRGRPRYRRRPLPSRPGSLPLRAYWETFTASRALGRL